MNCALRRSTARVKRVSTTSRCTPNVSCRALSATSDDPFDSPSRAKGARAISERAAMLTCVASGAYASPHTAANAAGSESSNASSKNAGGTSRSGSSAAAAAASTTTSASSREPAPGDADGARSSSVRPRGAGPLPGWDENATASSVDDSRDDSRDASSSDVRGEPSRRVLLRYGSKSERSTSGSTPG